MSLFSLLVQSHAMSLTDHSQNFIPDLLELSQDAHSEQ